MINSRKIKLLTTKKNDLNNKICLEIVVCKIELNHSIARELDSE